MSSQFASTLQSQPLTVAHVVVMVIIFLYQFNYDVSYDKIGVQYERECEGGSCAAWSGAGLPHLRRVCRPTLAHSLALAIVSAAAHVARAHCLHRSGLTVHREWWRVLTATYSHLNVLHIAFNMMSLWEFGRMEAIVRDEQRQQQSGGRAG